MMSSIFIISSCNIANNEAINEEEVVNDNEHDSLSNIAKEIENTENIINETLILPVNGNNLETFIPQGWKLKDSVEGDLNNDSLSDIAAVIEKDGDMDFSYPRIFFILLQNQNKSYNLSVKSEKLILKANEGGVWGDPYESIIIDRGSILVNFYGGSNWRWSNKYRFRYQDSDWYLIGTTTESFHTGSGEGTYEDYNFLTGDMIKIETDIEGNKTTEKINSGIKPLVKLVDIPEKQY